MKRLFLLIMCMLLFVSSVEAGPVTHYMEITVSSPTLNITIGNEPITVILATVTVVSTYADIVLAHAKNGQIVVVVGSSSSDTFTILRVNDMGAFAPSRNGFIIVMYTSEGWKQIS